MRTICRVLAKEGVLMKLLTILHEGFITVAHKIETNAL